VYVFGYASWYVDQNQFISFYEKSRTYLGDETLATLLNKALGKGVKEEQRERTQD